MKMNKLQGNYSGNIKTSNVNEFEEDINMFLDSVMLIKKMNLLQPEAVAQRCSVKMVFLEILQSSQENTCARVSFLINLQA